MRISLFVLSSSCALGLGLGCGVVAPEDDPGGALGKADTYVGRGQTPGCCQKRVKGKWVQLDDLYLIEVKAPEECPASYEWRKDCALRAAVLVFPGCDPLKLADDQVTEKRFTVNILFEGEKLSCDEFSGRRENLARLHAEANDGWPSEWRGYQVRERKEVGTKLHDPLGVGWGEAFGDLFWDGDTYPLLGGNLELGGPLPHVSWRTVNYALVGGDTSDPMIYRRLSVPTVICEPDSEACSDLAASGN